MFLRPYTLFDIIDTGEGELLQVTEIIFDIEARLNHTLNSKDYNLKENTLQTCQEHNDEQVKLLLGSKAEIEKEIAQGDDGSKTLTQLDYIKNTLKHFRNWYYEHQISFPDAPTIMPNKIGIFSSNLDFSLVFVGQTTYRLSENQSKIIKALYKSTVEGVDGLTYQEIANRAGLTPSSRVSSYFQSDIRWNDLLKYSRQNRRYSLITE